MAVKWIEGFETHTNTTTLAQKWLNCTGISNASGKVIGGSATGSMSMTSPSRGLDNTMIMGIGIRVNSNATFVTDNGFYFQRGAQEQCHLNIDRQAGVGYDLQLKTGATLIDETVVTLDFDIWYYIELKCECIASGAYELRVNGVTAFSGTGASLNESGLTGADTFGMEFLGGFKSARFFLDDLYVLDGSGAVNNDFIGSQTIEGIGVTADGATNNWTNDAGGGSNYDQVNDSTTAHDESGVGGTVSSGTLAQEDLYTMSDLESLTGSIAAVQFNLRAAVASAGTRNVLFKVKTGASGSASAGTSPVSDTVFKNIPQVMETNPSTAAVWTISDVNDTQLGVETGA